MWKWQTEQSEWRGFLGGCWRAYVARNKSGRWMAWVASGTGSTANTFKSATEAQEWAEGFCAERDTRQLALAL